MAGDGRVTVWASTQTPFPLQTQVARALKLPTEKVRVITPYVGGGFGGKSASQQAIEAARLTVAAGKPVRVVWDRTEEFFFDTFDPAAVINIRAGIDASKKIVSWDYEVIGAGERGSQQFYDVANHRTVVRGGWNAQSRTACIRSASGRGGRRARTPTRSPARCTSTCSRRRREWIRSNSAGSTSRRTRGCCGCCRPRPTSSAGSRRATPSKRGFGVALGDDAGTYVASIAQVKVDPATGAVQVLRVVCAQDMGVVVNPAGAMQQLEGCITMGLGYTLAEEVRFKDGVVLDKNFPTYHLPRFSWVPKIEGVLLDSPDLPAQGGGEPAIVTMGAAVANAVYDAIGARVTQLPLTAARVKAAMT